MLFRLYLANVKVYCSDVIYVEVGYVTLQCVITVVSCSCIWCCFYLCFLRSGLAVVFYQGFVKQCFFFKLLADCLAGENSAGSRAW